MISARDLFWLGLFGLVLAAWALLYLMTLDAGLDMLGRPGMWAETLRALCSGPQAGVAGLAALWTMWALMGVAMMLPTLLPVLNAHAGFADRLAAPVAGQGGLVAGFVAVWAGFAVLAAAAQMALWRAGLVDDFGAATSAGLQGALLVGAALWQVSPVKTRCQSVCLSPMAYFLGRFRPGFAGGLRMGLDLGLTCLGCCWAIMCLGFVGGVMNLAWMGLATLFMVLEKLPGIGHHLRLPAGLLLAAAGAAVLAATYL